MTEKQIQTAFASSRNLYITGPAGVGKSYRINEYIAAHPELHIMTCAPTGIAAINIGGDTAHRLFHIPVPAYAPPSFAKGKKGAITTAMLNVIAQADVIFLDEISMMRNDNFRFMIKVIRKAEKVKGSKIRLIVSGDFSQLPPVVKKNEATIMKKFGFDPSGYAFTTQEWKSCNFKVIELTDVKRQSDLEFIQALNRIRIGDCEDLSYWEQFVNPDPDYEDAIVVCGTNAEADRINNEYLDSLPGDLKALKSKKEGYCTAGYIDDIILVKEGCRIIFTVNDNIGKHYHNGTFGVIKYIGSDSVVVTIDGKDVSVKQHDFPIYSYTCKGNVLVKKELGTIHQYPFKIGKAVTIHKSQGQTFDKMILSPEIFAPGQLYVALSRVRGPEGLVLLREPQPSYLMIDSTVQKFYDNGYTWEIKKSAARKPVVKTVKKTAKKKTSKSTASKAKTTTKKKTTAKSASVKKKPASKRRTSTKQ